MSSDLFWNFKFVRQNNKLLTKNCNPKHKSACFDHELRDGRVPWRKGGLISNFKFYLSFENAIHCNDYISEKFWRNALSSGAVPVVFGPHRDDVKAMAPSNRLG